MEKTRQSMATNALERVSRVPDLDHCSTDFLKSDADLTHAVQHVTGSKEIVVALQDIVTARRVFEYMHPTLGTGLEDDKAQLKVLCEKAQCLGLTANEARNEICKLKDILRDLQDNSASCPIAKDSVANLLKHVEEERRKYESAIALLRDTKEEINRIKAYIRDNKVRSAEHFSTWLSGMQKELRM